MRRRVSLEHAVATGDGAGGVTLEWFVLATMWARMTPMGGGERAAYGRVDGQLACRIRIRHRRDVRSEMRFRLGDRLFDIEAAYDGDDTRTWLDCLCRERAQ